MGSCGRGAAAGHPNPLRRRMVLLPSGPSAPRARNPSREKQQTEGMGWCRRVSSCTGAGGEIGCLPPAARLPRGIFQYSDEHTLLLMAAAGIDPELQL